MHGIQNTLCDLTKVKDWPDVRLSIKSYVGETGAQWLTGHSESVAI